MNHDVTVKVWLTHMLLAVPVWLVMSLTVTAAFNVTGSARGWVSLLCAFASVVWIHEFRKRKRQKERHEASIGADRLSGRNERKVSTWSDIPQDPDE